MCYPSYHHKRIAKLYAVKKHYILLVEREDALYKPRRERGSQRIIMLLIVIYDKQFWVGARDGGVFMLTLLPTWSHRMVPGFE